MLLAAYYFFAYYGSLALFGAAGFALNMVSWLSGVTGVGRSHERYFQGAIQREFFAFTEWLVFLRRPGSADSLLA